MGGEGAGGGGGLFNKDGRREGTCVGGCGCCSVWRNDAAVKWNMNLATDLYKCNTNEDWKYIFIGRIMCLPRDATQICSDTSQFVAATLNMSIINHVLIILLWKMTVTIYQSDLFNKCFFLLLTNRPKPEEAALSGSSHFVPAFQNKSPRHLHRVPKGNSNEPRAFGLKTHHSHEMTPWCW